MTVTRGDRAGAAPMIAPYPRPGLDLLVQLVAGVYASPGAGLWADLRSGAFAEATETLAEELGLGPPACPWERLDWVDLQAAHVQLFVSAVAGIAAPPYVGYALDGELLGPSSLALSGFLAERGIAPADAWRDLPDHVAAVAEAANLLIATDRSDDAVELVTKYLSPWLRRYGETIARSDVSGFYGPMTRFLEAAVQEVEP
jgi:putative dimethyl sulfoxide reductase chaperone